MLSLPEPSDDQRLVLTRLSRSGTVSVDGTAGSGKTMLSALAVRSHPGRSAILTSTRSATAQINSRGIADQRDHYINTCSALAWRLVRSLGRYVGVAPNTRIDTIGLKSKSLASDGDELITFSEIEDACEMITRLPGMCQLFRSVYGQVILDESQDFSQQSCTWLIPLLETGRSLILFDSNQRLAQDAAPITAVIRSGRLKSVHQLIKHSIRCNDQVANAAQSVLAGKARLARHEMVSAKGPGPVGASMKILLLPWLKHCASIAVVAFQRKTVATISAGLGKATPKFVPLPHSVFRSAADDEKDSIAAELLHAVARASPVQNEIACLLVESAKAPKLTNSIAKALAGDETAQNRVKSLISDGDIPEWLSDRRLQSAKNLKPSELRSQIESWQLLRINHHKHTVPKGVHVSTINTAKGREFDAIAVYDDYADLIPSLGDGHRRRLGYVSLTRARRFFAIIGPKERATGLFTV